MPLSETSSVFLEPLALGLGRLLFAVMTDWLSDAGFERNTPPPTVCRAPTCKLAAMMPVLHGQTASNKKLTSTLY